MKLNLKMIAAAAAMVVGTGGAHAAITTITTSGQSGQLVLFAFNQVTKAYYIRDLGYSMNTFLPNAVTTSAIDGGGSPVSGNKTPTNGLTLDKVSNPGNFADATGAWSTFVSGATLGDIRWAVSASDTLGNTAGQGVVRAITSAFVAGTPSNGQITNYAASGAAGGLETLFNPVNNGLAAVYAAGVPSALTNNFGLGATFLSALDADAGLYYYARTSSGSAGAATLANAFAYTNGNLAQVRLQSNGDFSYTLAPVSAVPLPAAAWMMGAGLLGIGGMIRRRRAAALA